MNPVFNWGIWSAVEQLCCTFLATCSTVTFHACSIASCSWHPQLVQTGLSRNPVSWKDAARKARRRRRRYALLFVYEALYPQNPEIPRRSCGYNKSVAGKHLTRPERHSQSWPALYSGRGSYSYCHCQFPSFLAMIILVSNGPIAKDSQGQNYNTWQNQCRMTHRLRGWNGRPLCVRKLRFTNIHALQIEESSF
jgi:hypothetical protein